MSASPRVPYFDMAKAIGIILVFLGHSGCPYIGAAAYSFHMPLFFLISGYFLSCKQSLTVYAVKRTKQLMLPYLFTALAGMISMILFAVITDIRMPVSEIIRVRGLANMYGLGWYYVIPHTQFHIQMAGTLWFLPGLLFSMLTVRWALRFEYPFIIVLILSTLAYLSAKALMLPMSIQAGMNASLFVYIGYSARKYNFFKSSMACSWWLPCLSFLIWGISYFKIGNMGISMCYYSNPLVNIIAATGMTYLVVRCCIVLSRFGLISRVLTYIGASTLFLFCFHAFTQISLWQFSPEWHVHPIIWPNRTFGILFTVFSPIVALILRDVLMKIIRRFAHW